MTRGAIGFLLAGAVVVSPLSAAVNENPVAATRIVILVSQDAAPFRDAVAGLQRHTSRAVDWSVIPLHDDPARAAARVRGAFEGRPAAVVALGSVAVREAIAQPEQIPVVAGMILTAGEMAGAAHVTGVYLEFPVEVELEWLRRLLPSARQVGVIHHGDAATRRAEAARRVASRFGLTLHSFSVSGPAQIPDALAALAPRSDVIWGQLDPVIFNAETARSILLFSFRTQIPLAGPAPNWARSGGLLALERDYPDIGRQLAEVLDRVLGGTPPRLIPPSPPRTVRYVLNAKTAEQLRITFPASLMRDAAEVYR